MTRKFVYDTDVELKKKTAVSTTPVLYNFVVNHSFGLVTTNRGVNKVLLTLVLICITVSVVLLKQVVSPPVAEVTPLLGEGTGTRGL
jgi:hypothetical protein